MAQIKKVIYIIILVFLLLFLPDSLSAQEVFFQMDKTKNLEQKWEWAVKNGFELSQKKGFWVGYSIKKLMGENTFYGFYGNGSFVFTTRCWHESLIRGKSLGEIIYGKTFIPIEPSGYKIKEAAKKALTEMKRSAKSQRMIKKDLAVLFFFDRESGKIPKMIRLSNLSISSDIGDNPIFWLGKIDDNQSFDFLKKLYDRLATDKQKKRVISIIGSHSNSDQVVPFLRKIITSNEGDSVRGRAAIELGEHNIRESLKILEHTVKNDSSLYVRRRAVSGLEDLEMDAAADILIDLAKNAKHRKIRFRAISALGDIASRKTVEALKGLLISDDFTEVQKRAVYALEDLPGGQGVPYLIEIAKTHPKLKVRKSAIHCLGDSKDPRALDALIEIIKGK